MAAAIIPKPGTKFGPCKKACNHIDCKANRTTAESVCGFCSTPIGFETLYYVDQGAPCHARCLEESVEKLPA